MRRAVLIMVVGAAVAAPTPSNAADRFVSNERDRTWWSYVERPTRVHSAPRRSARVVGRLRPVTPLGLSERVVVLRRRVVRGKRWAQVRFSGLGSRRGWVRTRNLSAPDLVRTRLVIDRRRRRLRLYRSGRTVLQASVGVGAKGSPTPGGRSFIRERLVIRSRGGIYGPVAFGLSAYSRFRTYWPGGGQVGLHGTNQPELIPGAISNGCIRMRNSDIKRLDRMLPLGTPVLLR